MDDGMSAAPTQAAVRAQLYRYLRRALGHLPVTATLSLVHPELPQARLHRGVTLTSGDIDAVLDGEFFDIAYWVTGIAADAVGDCFDLIVRAWIEAGQRTLTVRDSRPRAVYTRTADGFGLSIRESVDGYMSLSGSTPPFAPGGPTGEPFPEFIDHPSSPSRR